MSLCGTSVVPTESEDISKFRMKETIGFWRAMSVISGIIIGAGIFVAPSGVLAATNGSISLCLLVWLCGGIIATLVALCYCEVATSLKESGGTFTGINLGFGRPFGFLFIWANVVTPMSDLAMLLTFGKYATQIFIGCEQEVNVWSTKLMALSLQLACVYLNCVSVKGSLKFQMVCTSSKFIAMAIVGFGGIALLISGYPTGRNNFSHFFDNKPLETLEWKRFSLGFYQVMWPYQGFNSLTYAYEEMRNPSKYLPKATMAAIGVVTFSYITINIGFLAVLTPKEMIRSKAVAATFATKLFGSMSWLLPLLVCTCIVGSFNTNVLVYGRVTHAAARRGLLPHLFAMTSIKYYSPMSAIILNSIPMFILICVGDFDSLIEALGFVTWTFFGMYATSVLILRRKYPKLPRPFKVPTFVPVFVVAIALFFVISPIIRNPHSMYVYSIVFFGIGLLAYYVFVHRNWQLPGTRSVTLFCQKLFQVAPTDWECVLEKL